MEIHTKQSIQACHPPSDELRTFQREKAAFLKSLQHFFSILSLIISKFTQRSVSQTKSKQIHSSQTGFQLQNHCLSPGASPQPCIQEISLYRCHLPLLILKSSAQSLRSSCHNPIPELQPLGGPTNSLYHFAPIPYHHCFWCHGQQLHRAHKKTQILQPCPSLDLGSPFEDYFFSLALLGHQSTCPFLLIRFLSRSHYQVPALQVGSSSVTGCDINSNDSSGALVLLVRPSALHDRIFKSSPVNHFPLGPSNLYRCMLPHN